MENSWCIFSLMEDSFAVITDSQILFQSVGDTFINSVNDDEGKSLEKEQQQMLLLSMAAAASKQ